MLWISIILCIVLFEWRNKKKMDQNLKFNQSIEKWNGRIILKKYYNKGAALDTLSKHPKLLIRITMGFILVLFFCLLKIIRTPKQYTKKLAFSLILGGAISNFLDRITKHYVIDYFSFSWKKIRHIVFNIADFCIFIGSMLLILVSLKEKK